VNFQAISANIKISTLKMDEGYSITLKKHIFCSINT